MLNAFLSVCTWQTVYYIWRPNLPDEADNHLVELAVAGRAEAIVTWNTQGFQQAELRFPGLRIVRPMLSWQRMVKMTTLTIRLPDDTHARLRQLAKQRKMSLNKLIEELSTVALTQFEAEIRFRARASQGSVATGLQLLEKLDALTGEELEQR